MNNVSRVLVVGGDPAESQALTDKLTTQGFFGLTSLADGSAADLAAQQQPDVIILADCVDGDAVQLTIELKKQDRTRHIPVMMLCAAERHGVQEAGLAAGVDDLLRKPFPDIELFSRLRVLTRLNTMYHELTRRAETDRKFGVSRFNDPLSPVHAEDARIVVVGAPGKTRDAVVATLPRTMSTAVVDETYAANDLLAENDFDAVIIADAGPADNSLELCAGLRSNPRLYTLPILVVAAPDSFDDFSAPFRAGASDVIEAPSLAEELRPRTLALVRQQRLRLRMTAIYREGGGGLLVDSLTKLFNHGYLHEHLNGLIEQCGEFGRELTVGFVDLSALDRINQAYGYAAGDLYLRQVGTLIGSLVRGEDLVARFGGEKIVVVMPDTSMSVATVALNRIGGVVAFTDFAVADSRPIVSARPFIGCAGAEPGDTAETLIARANSRRHRASGASLFSTA